MKIIKYFIESLFIIFLLIVFKILGLKFSSNLGSIIGGLLGPFFRSKHKIISNIKKALPEAEQKDIEMHYDIDVNVVMNEEELKKVELEYEQEIRQLTKEKQNECEAVSNT